MKLGIFAVMDKTIFEDLNLWVRANDQTALESSWMRLTHMFDLTFLEGDKPESVADWLVMQTVAEFMDEMHDPFMSADRNTRTKFMKAWHYGIGKTSMEYDFFLNRVKATSTFNIDELHEIILTWFAPAREIFK